MQRDPETTLAPGELFASLPWPAGWTAAGVIEILEPMVSEQRKQGLSAVLERRLSSVTVLFEAPHDPHNGAAVMRSCDAFGVQELHVIPRSEAFLASNLVAKGTERWVEVVEHTSASAAAGQLRARDFQLVVADAKGTLVPEDLAKLPRLALVLGNERDGVSNELASLADASVRIPMTGFVESLNVSVSAAILLRAATLDRPGDLSESDRTRLFARGLFYSVRRAREILSASAPR